MSSGETPSLDFSVGSFGREFQTSHADATGNTGVCRVKVAAYCKVTSGHELRIRFKTAEWSQTEIKTTGTSYAWVTGVGYLDCGQTVLDRAQLEVLAEVDSGGTGEVQYVYACYLPE